MGLVLGLVLVVIAAAAVWWCFLRGVTMVFPEGFSDPEENAGRIEGWLSRELDSIVIGRDDAGRYFVFAVGMLKARQWRARAALAFGLPESAIELRGSW